MERHPPRRVRGPRPAPHVHVPLRRRPDPRGLRPDRVGHPRRHGRQPRPRRALEHRLHRGRVPVLRIHPGRAPALRAPRPRVLHPGHRHGWCRVHAFALHRPPARRAPRQRHPPGGAAQRHRRARHAELRRRLRSDDPPRRSLRHRGGLRRGGRGQDQARKGRRRRRRRLRRPLRRGHHRLR